MDTVRQCLFLLVQIQQRAVFTRAAERFATFVHPGTAKGRNPPIDKHQKHPAQFALLIAPYALVRSLRVTVKKYVPPATRLRRYRTMDNNDLFNPRCVDRSISPDSAALHPGYTRLTIPIHVAWMKRSGIRVSQTRLIPHYATLHAGYACFFGAGSVGVERVVMRGFH